jgi:hypothetical protein
MEFAIAVRSVAAAAIACAGCLDMPVLQDIKDGRVRLQAQHGAQQQY